jgi:metacaspase-1
MAKKAVLIGVNRYRMPGADLRGCVNDVKNMRTLLTSRYGFKAADISVLTDFAATKKAIETAIRSLIRGARSGDVVLVHFSGHGSNVPDNDGDEADKRDEILCPSDLDWKKPLRDDWLRSTFDSLRTGVSLTVITDCCHSGTITRAVQPPDARIMERYLPSPWDLVAEESDRALRGTTRATVRKSSQTARKKKDVVAVVEMPEMLITGCRDKQTAADAWIKGSYNGALTYYLVESLSKAKRTLSYREVHDLTSSMLKRGGYEQVPQLEGRRDRFDAPFLSPIE